MAKDKITLMLDSGAFSAWKQGATVNIKEYIRFIKAHENRLFACVNLDVIPGSPGVPRGDPERAAKASDYNLQTMLDAGTRPMPVFHQFENFKWLVKMVDDGHDCIGISPSDRQPTAQRMEWMDKVYTLLCDSKGRPCVKTHAFGVTSYPILYTYPFYTADSTTWLMLSGHGRLQVPAMNPDGSVDYTKQNILTVSPRSARTRSPRQLVSMDRQGDIVRSYLAKLGLSQSDIEWDYIARSNAAIRIFEDLVRYRGENPARLEAARRQTWLGLFRPPAPTEPLKPLRPFKLKVFYVAWANKAHSILCDAGMTYRLLSYLHIKDWSPDEFDSFMQTGLIGGTYIPRKVNGTPDPFRSVKARRPSTRTRRSSAAASVPLVRPGDRERI